MSAAPATCVQATVGNPALRDERRDRVTDPCEERFARELERMVRRWVMSGKPAVR